MRQGDRVDLGALLVKNGFASRMFWIGGGGCLRAVVVSCHSG